MIKFEDLAVDTEQWREFEVSAYNGTLDLRRFDEEPEQLTYFYLLSVLSAYYKQGQMDKETFLKNKKTLYDSYQKQVSHRLDGIAYYRFMQDKIKGIGKIKSEINHSDDVKEIARLGIEAIAVMTDDDVFRLNLEKIDE